MTNSEREILQRLKDDFPHYAIKCLKIRTKAGCIEPLKLNKAQEYIHNKLQAQLAETKKVRALILKGRQQGCSTYVGARFYHKVTQNFGIQAFIMAHEKDATDNLYAMARRYYEHTPDIIKAAVFKSNAKELVFGALDSGYKLGTAENKKVGRSATIQLLHGSEVAFWNNADEHAKGLLQAVPDGDNSEIILESTANGVGNFFYQEWQKAESGESDYIPIFVPWFWQDEYKRSIDDDFAITPEELELSNLYKLTYEQIYWRRRKIIQLSANGIDGEKAFKQEYPCNPNEAFQLTGEDSFIDSDIVMRARKAQGVEGYGPLLVGCDPARFGDDRTSIAIRQGRKVLSLQSYSKKDTMEVAGILYTLINKENPAKVFVDVGGLGAGVVDRLKELVNPDIVIAVNAGDKPLDADRYRNKKAEMWATMKDWLNQFPCKIPDDNELHADLCGIKYKFDSNTRLVMESKDDMKKRGVRSPDCAEAMMLTFAMPDSAIASSIRNEQNDIVSSLADSFNQKVNAINNARR